MGHRTARTSLAHKLKSKRSARIGIVILILGMLALITEAQYEPRSAVVERVIDGDSIEVRVDGQTHTVRLIGVDTPETKHPTKAVQSFGREATAFTKAHLEGKTVALEKDRTGDTVDRYGRLLRYVRLDGDNFNARLIREDYAHAYRGASFSKRQEFIDLEDKRGGGESAYGAAAEIHEHDHGPSKRT